MATYEVRYEMGKGPDNSDDVVRVEAAMYKTDGDFIDFYSDSAVNVGGTHNPKGDVVRRIKKTIIADIVKVE